MTIICGVCLCENERPTKLRFFFSLLLLLLYALAFKINCKLSTLQRVSLLIFFHCRKCCVVVAFSCGWWWIFLRSVAAVSFFFLSKMHAYYFDVAIKTLWIHNFKASSRKAIKKWVFIKMWRIFDAPLPDAVVSMRCVCVCVSVLFRC